MKQPLYLGFYGRSNTGKTNLITALIKHFTAQDYKVATIKQTSHHYSIDSAGKDTFKHADAGADLVCFQSAIETSFIFKQKISFQKIKQIMECFDCYDIVLIEGANEDSIPKIRISDTIPLRENTVFTFTGDINKVLMFIQQQIKRS